MADDGPVYLVVQDPATNTDYSPCPKCGGRSFCIVKAPTSAGPSPPRFSDLKLQCKRCNDIRDLV